MSLLRDQRTQITGAIVGVVAVTLLLAVGLISLVGASPGDAASTFYDGAFGTVTNFGETLTGAVPLVLVALGWIVALRAGRIQIGYPGQILIGGLFTAVVALKVDGLPGPLHIALALLAGAVGGGFYAGIAAWLYAWRGVQEIVSTLLLNLIAFQIVAWAVRGPLQETVGNQPQTDPFAGSVRWPTVGAVEGGTLSWDVVLVPVAVLVVFLLLWRTAFGFKLRLVGANRDAAVHAGYNARRIGVSAVVISGALAGLAGACLLLAGDTPGMTEHFEAENGFNGIAVALLAFNAPLGTVLTAVLFSALSVGSSAVEATLNVPATIASVLQGLVILLVLVSTTVIFRRSQRHTDDDSIPARSAVGALPSGRPELTGNG